MTDPTIDFELRRHFAAPVEEVYRAFIDPVQLAQWFGPLTFHVPLDTVEVDARPGGVYRLTMVGHAGLDMSSPVDARFVEVVENSLLVGEEATHGFPGLPDGTVMRSSYEFLPDGDGTLLVVRQTPHPTGLVEGATLGWTQSFGKLDALLATPVRFRSGAMG